MNKIFMSDSSQKIPHDMKILLDKWQKSARFLRSLHMALGVVTISFSVIVAAGLSTDIFPEIGIQIVAILAAISVGMLSGFDIGSKANRMMNGWRILNSAKFRYESEEQGFGLKELNDAYEKAEFVIGDVKENVR